MIITAESGSGKTLSYLLPIINQLNFHKDTQEASSADSGTETNAGYFKLNKETEHNMFKNADELQSLEKLRYKERKSFGNNDDKSLKSEMKGAIILSYSKELINQIYVQARKLDTEERILFNRATSSLQMKSPIVEWITPSADKKDEKHYSDDELFNLSLSNVINNSSWKLTDVILSTPLVMSHILNSK